MDDTATVHLQREHQYVALEHAAESLDLLRSAMFKELLDDIVAKDVDHQRQGVREDLGKHELLVGHVGSLELLLDEARTMLVLAELDNVTDNVLEMMTHACVRELIDACGRE